jgi:uncharacterized protein (DUF2062 family)
MATAAPRCVRFEGAARSDRHTSMTRLTALLVVTILSLLALLHVYWALRSQRTSAATIPEIDGRPAFRPSRLATLAVAIALLSGAALVAIAGRLWVDPLTPPVVRLLTFALGAVFVARAIGDFRLVGFFKQARVSRFARLDTWVYAPLCLLLGLAVLFVAYRDV